MKTITSVCLLLFISYSAVRCHILPLIDEDTKNCTFILSKAGYEEFLHQAIPSFEYCTREFKNDANLEIKLRNYTLPSFPIGTFTNLPRLRSFRLRIDGCRIHLLSPMQPHFVFKNMKFEEATFHVSDSGSLAGWNWTVLSGFENNIKRFEFIAVRSKIIYLPPSFGKVADGQLTAIRILRCELKWLGKNVFGPFSKLKYLELQDNFIENFERIHLPEAPSKLQVLDLSKNRLQYILPDVFEALENIQSIFLLGNNIKMPSNEVEVILAAAHLHYIDGVLYPCDCKKIEELTKKIINKNISKEKCYTTEKDIEIVDFMKESCVHS